MQFFTYLKHEYLFSAGVLCQSGCVAFRNSENVVTILKPVVVVVDVFSFCPCVLMMCLVMKYSFVSLRNT